MSKPNSPRAEEQGETKRMRLDGPSISSTFGSASIEVDGIPVTITGFREMEPEMRAIFVESFENSDSMAVLQPFAAKDASGSFSNEVFVISTDAGVDHVALRPQGSSQHAKPFLVDDLIMGDSISPLQWVQYCYQRSDGSLTPWLFCGSTETGIDYYRSNKFGIWKDSMRRAFDNCIAAFYPEVNRGYALTNLYDATTFPFYAKDGEENARYSVEFHGKTIRVPRPLHAMRIWDATISAYKELSCVMDGAPTPEDMPAFWQDFLNQLRTELGAQFGPDFIDDCLSMPLAELKEKYK